MPTDHQLGGDASSPPSARAAAGAASSSSLSSVVNSITTANTQPFRSNVVGLSLAVFHFVVIGVAAILVISSIASPTWVTSGWDDVFTNATSAPIMWSPFSFCRGSGCQTLPNAQYFGGFACASGAAAPADGRVGSELRVSQAFAILGLLALIAATAFSYRLVDGIVLSKRALNFVDTAFGHLHREQQQQQRDRAHTSDAEEQQQDETTSSLQRRRRRGDGDDVRRHHEPHHYHGDDAASVVEVVHSRVPPPVASLPVRVDVVARAIVQNRVEPMLRELNRLCPGPSSSSFAPTTAATSDAADAIVQSALHALQQIRREHGSAPLAELEGLRLWWALDAGALLLSTVFLGVAIGVFDTLERSTLNCGAPYCDVLMAAAGGPCGRGAAYRGFLAGTILSGVAFLGSLVLWLLYRRPAQMSFQFLHNFVSMLQEEVSEAEAVVHRLRMRFGKDKVRASTAARAVQPRTEVSAVGRAALAVGGGRRLEDGVYGAAGRGDRGEAATTAATVGTGRRPQQQPHPQASVGDRPPPRPRMSVHGVPMDYQSSAPDEPGWAFDEQEQLFFSLQRKMYYDPRSAQYYDPKSGLWWNGKEWYRVQK